MQLSVVIIAKNEEANLHRTLSRLSWCDDVVLIDDFSTDKTASIAESFGCRVFQRKFDGFGTQKQFAVAQARHNWVLNIDADEVLSEELIAELKELPENTQNAYAIPVRHVFMNREFKYGKESRYMHVRLFNKTECNFDSAVVHEKVVHRGVPVNLNGLILHYSYRDLSHFFSKFNVYTDAGARKLKAAGKKRTVAFCILSFPLYFFKHYFSYGNVMNGVEGFIWSYLSAWYHTVKYLKLYELNRNA